MGWWPRLVNLFRADRLDREVERELEFHVQERTDELEAAGVSRDEARRQAQRQFGPMTQQVERTRDMDVYTRLESAGRNLRQAARALWKAPGFTAVIVVTLALGIGANSAVFSAIYAVLLRPLPYPEGDRLMQVTQTNSKTTEAFVAPVRLAEWDRANRSFTAISGYYTENTSETSGELPERLKRAWVAPRFLTVLGIAPVIGRDFTSAEQRFGGPSAVLISHRLWQRRFGADPSAIGKTLRIDRGAYRIAGVLPASFTFPDRDTDLWTVSPTDAPYAQSREATWFNGIGRLRPGVTAPAAQADLAVVQSQLGAQFPKTDAALSARVAPLKEVTVGGVRRSLWILYGSVSLLLLLTCSNIAALLLSRAAGRQREVSVRYSLGASRSSIVLQMLAEVTLLALLGAAGGLLVAGGAARVFQTLAKDLPRVQEIVLDRNVVFYSMSCALLVTLLAGILPAIRGTRRNLAKSMAQGGRTQVSGANVAQFWLVGTQVALAVVLLAGAGLLLRSFQELGRVSPGFEPQHVLTFHISSSWGETTDPARSRQRTNTILEAMRGLPGIENAATASALPGVPQEYEVEFMPTTGRAESDPRIRAHSRAVAPSYFATLQIPLVAGEACREESGVNTLMVNRTFAERYFKGTGEVVGRRLRSVADSSGTTAEIRGVVGDARENGLDRMPPAMVYWCASFLQPGTFFLVRTTGDPAALSDTIRRKVHELEPQRSVYDVTPLTGHIAEAYAENRLRTILLAGFALTAIALASVGLYGTLSYTVNLRRREVALRMALGARQAQVLRQILEQGVRVAGMGCAVGLLLAALLHRLLAGLLYGVSAADPVTIAGVMALVLAVAVAASLLPALRAARLAPVDVLRDE